MLKLSYKNEISQKDNKFAAITVAKKGDSIKSGIVAVYVYCPCMDMCDYYSVSSKQLIDLLSADDICKISAFAEHDVATLQYNGLLISNYISANSLLRSLEIEYELTQPLGLVKATEYGVIDDTTVGWLNQYTVKLYEHTLSAFDYFNKLSDTKRKRLRKAIEREIRVLPSVVELNLNGLKFRYNDWMKLLDGIKTEYSQLQQRLCSILQIENLNSPQQLLASLHNLGISVPDTSETTLKQYRGNNELISDIVKYRKYTKTINNYGDKLRQYMDCDSQRIYSIYTAYGAITGRIVARKLAIQGLPRIAKRFLHCEDGNILIEADYKAIEMVLLAHISKCDAMKMEINSNTDLHRKTAAIIFNIPMQEVDDKKRAIAKRVNFAVCYGSTEIGLSKTLIAEGINITVEQTAEFMQRFFSHYDAIEKWQWACRNSIGISSLGGRYHSLENASPTQAINWSIQATGADILKDALINLRTLIGDNKTYKLVEAVHDSIVLEVPILNKDEAKSYLTTAMTKAFNDMIPDITVGIDFEYRNMEVNDDENCK